MTQKTAEVQAIPGVGSAATLHPRLFAELFASLASLLRSYTAAHGLHQQREASVDLSDEEITVRHREKWLRLIRNDAILTWTRENGIMGTMELTEAGTLRNADHEEAMDLVAEQWAREIMR